MAGKANPQIIVEIIGDDRAGKSVVAQLLWRALRDRSITAIRSDEISKYPPVVVHEAVDDLRTRGLSVEIIERETKSAVSPKHQIDARVGMPRFDRRLRRSA